MSSRRILVATLNWGLGHSARCIPLIKRLLDQNHDVFLASDGDAGFLLREEFPGLPYFSLPSYEIRYPRSNFWLHWSSLAPRLVNCLYREKQVLNKIMKLIRVDTIISDNRYGVYHYSAQNILLTHQLSIALENPTKNIINRLIRSRINYFDQCWVPDWNGEDNLSGQLSQGNLKIPKIFIGPLSRFVPQDCSPEIDLLVILSGPEPSRTDFQEVLEKKLPRMLKTVFLMGRPGIDIGQSRAFRSFSHLPTADLNHMLNVSRIVLSRSGYSSIMDYYVLNKKAVMIPTPLQPEQSYLANRHRCKPQFRVLNHDLVGFHHVIDSLNAETANPVFSSDFQLPDW